MSALAEVNAALSCLKKAQQFLKSSNNSSSSAPQNSVQPVQEKSKKAAQAVGKFC